MKDFDPFVRQCNSKAHSLCSTQRSLMNTPFPNGQTFTYSAQTLGYCFINLLKAILHLMIFSYAVLHALFVCIAGPDNEARVTALSSIFFECITVFLDIANAVLALVSIVSRNFFAEPLKQLEHVHFHFDDIDKESYNSVVNDDQSDDDEGWSLNERLHNTTMTW